MAGRTTSKTELFTHWMGGTLVVADEGQSTGGRVWVHSGTGYDSTGYGLGPDKPCATLDYAIGLCTANKKTIIYAMPGHTETWTTTGVKVTLDVAGIRIIGLGQGADRPTFSFGHTGTTWTWSAAGVWLENVLLVTAIDSVATYATISGADAVVKDVELRDTTDIEVIRGFTVTGARPTFINVFHNGYTGGNANVGTVLLDGVDGALVEGGRFLGKATTSVIGMEGHACTDLVVQDAIFLVTATTNLSKNVVDTITGSTWAVENCFDLAAGSGFSGGSGAALAKDDVSAIAALIGTITNTGGTATIGAVLGDVANTAIATRLASIQTMTDKVGTVTNTGGTASMGAILGDVANTSVATRLTNILAAVGKPGAFGWGACDAGMAGSTTTIVCDDLAGYGNDFFNGHFYMQVLLNANSATNAPEDQIRAITDYVSATGTFTTSAFGANVEASDIILILHESQVFIGEDNNDNTASTANVAANEDGSVLERLEQIQEAVNAGSGSPMPANTSVADFVGKGTATALPANVSLYDVLAGANGLPAFPNAAVPANDVSMAEVLRSIWAGLMGTAAGENGIATFPNAASPANDVSLAEVLRAIWAATQGTAAGENGVTTWPASAAPGDNVSLAEGLRWMAEVLRHGTGGTIPANNRSVLDELRGAALNYQGMNYLAASIDLTNATWNTQATHEVWTVTGAVRMRSYIECTADVTGAGSAQAGVATATNAWIASTVGVDIDAGEHWCDATPADNDNFGTAVLDKVVTGGVDVGYEVTGAALTGGTLVWRIWWEPLNATGAVVAGDGSALV